MDREQLDDALAISIAITGHRDIREEDHQRIIQNFDDLVFPLLNEYKYLKIRLISGLATGADQLLINRGLQLQKEGKPIEILGVLPMPKNDYLEDFKDHTLEEFQQLLQKLKKNGNRVLELSACAQEKRDQCYRNLGQYLANRADIIVGVWNGVESGNIGGTSDVIALGTLPVLSVIKPLLEQDPVQESLSINATFYGQESNIIYIVPAERSENEQGQCRFKQCGFWHRKKWYLDKKDTTRFVTTSDLSPSQKKRFDELNVLSNEILNTTPNKECQLKYSPLEEYKNEDFDLLKKRFQQIDSLADRFQKKVDRFHNRITLTTFCLALSFLAYAKLLPDSKVLLFLYIVIFISAVAIFYLTDPNTIKTRRALYRLASESLRIEFFAQAAGLRGEIGNLSLARKLHTYGMEEVEVIRSVIQQSTLLANVQTLTVDKSTIIKDWLEDQYDYYKKKSHELHKEHIWWERGFRLTIIFPIILAVFLYVFTDFTKYIYSFIFEQRVTLKAILLFLIGLIPICGALIEVHSNFGAVKEMQHQYQTLHRYLENAIRVLKEVKDDKHYKDILKIVSVELSSEHTRWAVTTKHRSMEPPTGG